MNTTLTICLLILCTASAPQAQDFRVTSGKHNETEDLKQVVRNEFGSNYRVADWNDVVAYCQRNSAMDFVRMIDMGLEEQNSVLVTKSGKSFWTQPGLGKRYFYITRFDHHLPTKYTYLSHANINNHAIDLGSWTGFRFPVLCFRTTSEHSQSAYMLVHETEVNGSDDYHVFRIGKLSHESGSNYVFREYGTVVAYNVPSIYCSQFEGGTKCDMNLTPVLSSPPACLVSNREFFTNEELTSGCAIRISKPKPALPRYADELYYVRQADQSSSVLGRGCRWLFPANVPKDARDAVLNLAGEQHNNIRTTGCATIDFLSTLLESLLGTPEHYEADDHTLGPDSKAAIQGLIYQQPLTRYIENETGKHGRLK